MKIFSRSLQIALCCISFLFTLYGAWRLYEDWASPPNYPSAAPSFSREELKEIWRFEQQRLQDSMARQAQYQRQREEWQHQREKRALQKAEREQRYEQQRQQWAAQEQERALARAERQAHYDSLRKLYPEKLTMGSIVDLNTADTLLLQRIPGIGKQTALAILSYRDRLGGFVDPRQLSEIPYVPHQALPWFQVGSLFSVRKLSINRASFRDLLRHPYLNFEQVKAIMEHRQKRGNLRDWQDLNNCPHFTASDFARLQPYSKF